MYLTGVANAVKVLDIPRIEETDPVVLVSGDIRNGGIAWFARDFAGVNAGALTFDRGVRRYSR